MFSVSLNFLRSYFIIFFKGQLEFCLVVSGSPSGDSMLLCVDFSVLLVLQKIQLVKLSHAYCTSIESCCDKFEVERSRW